MKKLTIDDFPGFTYKEDFSCGRILATPSGIIFTDVDEFDNDPTPDPNTSIKMKKHRSKKWRNSKKK